MTGESENNVLDYLREQFRRVHEKLDRIVDDVTNLKVRMSSLESETGHVRIGLAEVNGRLDRVDTRLGRLERQADIVKA